MKNAAPVVSCLLMLGWASLVAAQPPERESEPTEGVEEGGSGDDMLGADEIAAPASTYDDAEEIEDAPPPPPPPVPPRPAQPPPPSATDEGEGAPSASGGSTDIPINFELHGYYRARLVTTDSQPVPGPSTGRDAAAQAAYGFMRLRLDPAIVFGSDRDQPVAALRAQIDALDNVVFGDNARAMGTPLFAADPTATTILSGQPTDYFFLRRLWLEFLTPIGQIRIGRQPSQGGLGLLFNDGNGFRNDFGDALSGTTYDRILFATRPISIVNALTRGDARPTPLIFAIAYDWLAEDTLGVGAVPGPRSSSPFAWLTGGEDDVWQTSLVLVWDEADFNSSVNARDELMAGLILTHRGQDSTSSNIYIGDLFWRLRWSAFGRRAPQIYTEGELYTIQGSTYGVALFSPTGSVDPVTGRTGARGGANIWGGAARIGVDDPIWSARVESGFSTGQHGSITSVGTYDTLTQRPNNASYQVGLLLYPVALAVRTANAYTPTFDALWSGGGVWNSVYFLPQVRVRPLPGLELIGQFLIAFADQTDGIVLANTNATGDTSCLFAGEQCLLGWEADLAIKLSWGPHDELRWSNELGIMNAGPALGPKLANSLLWTAQSRIAFVF